MNPIDPNKIQQKIIELNADGQPGAPYWIANNSLNTVTTIIRNEDGSLTFNGNSGVPLQIFTNTNTGEIKAFDARAFIAN